METNVEVNEAYDEAYDESYQAYYDDGLRHDDHAEKAYDEKMRRI